MEQYRSERLVSEQVTNLDFGSDWMTRWNSRDGDFIKLFDFDILMQLCCSVHLFESHRDFLKNKLTKDHLYCKFSSLMSNPSCFVVLGKAQVEQFQISFSA